MATGNRELPDGNGAARQIVSPQAASAAFLLQSGIPQIPQPLP
jgi:hypothetical protein